MNDKRNCTRILFQHEKEMTTRHVMWKTFETLCLHSIFVHSESLKSNIIYSFQMTLDFAYTSHEVSISETVKSSNAALLSF